MASTDQGCRDKRPTVGRRNHARGTTMSTIPAGRDGTPKAYEEPGRGWQIASGIVLIVAGFLAVLMPAVAALATAIVFAWLVTLSGAFEVAHALFTRHREGFGWK